MNMNQATNEVANYQHEVELNNEITLLCLPNDNRQQEELGNVRQTHRFQQQCHLIRR